MKAPAFAVSTDRRRSHKGHEGHKGFLEDGIGQRLILTTFIFATYSDLHDLGVSLPSALKGSLDWAVPLFICCTDNRVVHVLQFGASVSLAPAGEGI